MLLNFLLASITILLYFFFLFLVVFNNFLMIPVIKENKRLKLTLAIHTGVPTMLEKEMTDIPPLLADKTIKILSI